MNIKVMNYENFVKYQRLLSNTEPIKSSSKICEANLKLDKCACRSEELCQGALAAALRIRSATANNLIAKAQRLKLISVRTLKTKKRPYRFISLKEKAME